MEMKRLETTVGIWVTLSQIAFQGQAAPLGDGREVPRAGTQARPGWLWGGLLQDRIISKVSPLGFFHFLWQGDSGSPIKHPSC